MLGCVRVCRCKRVEVAVAFQQHDGVSGDFPTLLLGGSSRGGFDLIQIDHLLRRVGVEISRKKVRHPGLPKGACKLQEDLQFSETDVFIFPRGPRVKVQAEERNRLSIDFELSLEKAPRSALGQERVVDGVEDFVTAQNGDSVLAALANQRSELEASGNPRDNLGIGRLR